MKVIIAGDRDINENDARLISDAVKCSGFKITEVVSGCAKGGDALGELWANYHKVKIARFKADWKNITIPGASVKHGQYGPYNAKAGFDRNQKMADYADALIALQPNGPSAGTQDMIKRANAKGIPVYIYPPPVDNSPDYDLGIDGSDKQPDNGSSYVF